MKKFFALVLAVAMVLSMSTAFATIGWAQGSTGAAATKGVSISVSALEYSPTKQDYTEFGLSNELVWKAITGRVVKDTIVKFPITVTVPNAKAAGMTADDYVGGKISVTLSNATFIGVKGAEKGYYLENAALYTMDSMTNSVLKMNVTPSADAPFGTTYKFTVVAIVSSTAAVDCKVNFSMGQKANNENKPMTVGAYTMWWAKGDHFTVAKGTNHITFMLDANNKFTSEIYFTDAAFGIYDGKVAYCPVGHITFNGLCACNFGTNTNIINNANYEQVKADFNELMAFLGFSFSYGNFTNAYCTTAGIQSLLKGFNANGNANITACTELGVTATTPSVSIPQTGAVSVIGYALVALAGAALAISKKN